MTDPRDLIQRLADALEDLSDAETDVCLILEARAYLLQPETPTNCIYFGSTFTEEIMRFDNEGLHYKGEFIADAGEAHRLMVAWLRRNSDGP